jgi:hypothetical protein
MEAALVWITVVKQTCQNVDQRTVSKDLQQRTTTRASDVSLDAVTSSASLSPQAAFGVSTCSSDCRLPSLYHGPLMPQGAVRGITHLDSIPASYLNLGSAYLCYLVPVLSSAFLPLPRSQPCSCHVALGLNPTSSVIITRTKSPALLSRHLNHSCPPISPPGSLLPVPP